MHPSNGHVCYGKWWIMMGFRGALFSDKAIWYGCFKKYVLTKELQVFEQYFLWIMNSIVRVICCEHDWILRSLWNTPFLWSQIVFPIQYETMWVVFKMNKGGILGGCSWQINSIFIGPVQMEISIPDKKMIVYSIINNDNTFQPWKWW